VSIAGYGIENVPLRLSHYRPHSIPSIVKLVCAIAVAENFTRWGNHRLNDLSLVLFRLSSPINGDALSEA